MQNGQQQELNKEMDVGKPRHGLTVNTLDYVMTNMPYIVKPITVINQINIGSDRSIVVDNV